MYKCHLRTTKLWKHYIEMLLGLIIEKTWSSKLDLKWFWLWFMNQKTSEIGRSGWSGSWISVWEQVCPLKSCFFSVKIRRTNWLPSFGYKIFWKITSKEVVADILKSLSWSLRIKVLIFEHNLKSTRNNDVISGLKLCSFCNFTSIDKVWATNRSFRS